MFRVENISSLGRVVGYAGFNDAGKAEAHLFSVLQHCRKNPACQIKQVAVYRDGELKYVRKV